MVLWTKPSHGGFGNFFPTGTYSIIGTMCVKFENVMKSKTKKNKKIKRLFAKFDLTSFGKINEIENDIIYLMDSTNHTLGDFQGRP